MFGAAIAVGNFYRKPSFQFTQGQHGPPFGMTLLALSDRGTGGSREGFQPAH